MAKVIERELGESLAFSIGTAMPLESAIFTENSKVETLWVNVRTLVRNFVNSIENPERYSRQDLLENFISEIQDILSLLEQQNVEVVYYTTAPPRRLERIFRWAKVKIPKTPKQAFLADIEEMAIDMAKRSIPDSLLKEFVVRLNGDRSKFTHILTSYPVDLLSHYEFGKLILLESHTGETKGRYEWIKKLNKDPKYFHLPFNTLTLQVLGDRSANFYAAKPSVKNELLDIAASGKWTPLTSMTKIKSDINKYGTANKDLFLHISRSSLP